jgi:hypothetical protein
VKRTVSRVPYAPKWEQQERESQIHTPAATLWGKSIQYLLDEMLGELYSRFWKLWRKENIYIPSASTTPKHPSIGRLVAYPSYGLTNRGYL